MGGRLRVVAGLLGSFWPAVAGAQVEVASTPADAGCISSAELEERVLVWLKHRDSPRRIEKAELDSSRPNVTVTAREGAGWAASVEVTSAAHGRVARRQITTTARDCRDLDAALVVVLGVLLDSQKDETDRPEFERNQTGPTDETSGDTSREREAELERPTRLKWTFHRGRILLHPRKRALVRARVPWS
jgi:hypothetical protein